MRPKIFLFLLLSLYIVNCTLYIEAQATTRYVSPTGSSTPPYTSWETAADSIMECINISVFGDTIYVANGTYKEQVIMIPGLSLIGAGMDSCIVDTQNLAFNSIHTLEIRDSCILKGFKLNVASSLGPYWGTAVFMDDSTLGCIIEDNYMVNASLGVWATDCVIKRNIISNVNTGIIVVGSLYYSGTFNVFLDSNYISFSTDGIYSLNTFNPQELYARGNIFNYGNPVSSLLIMQDNTFSYTYVPEFSNNLAINTIERLDTIIYEKGVKNTLEGNFNNNVFLAVLKDAYYTTWSSTINNNIVQNSVNGVHRVNGTVNASYNNFWNVVNPLVGITSSDDTTKNQRVDPMFVNEDSLDLHLQKYSPLIDAGDPNILDKDGTRSDIGIYGGSYGEAYQYIDLAPRTPVNLTASLDSLTLTLNWNKNTEADFSHYNIYRDTTSNFTIDSTKLILSQTDTSFIDMLPGYITKIYYQLTSADNQGNESEPSEEVGLILTSIDEHQEIINDYRLYQNYPNPFNPSTKISYRLKERGYVKLYVYDIKGELVSVLVNQTQEAGFYEVDFNVKRETSEVKSDLASGIYIYQIMVKNEINIPVFTDMKKMVYIK